MKFVIFSIKVYMILIKNKDDFNTIFIQKPHKLNERNFTLLLQNVVTKEIFKYNLTDSNIGSLYFKFNINVSGLGDGEYYGLLISNPHFVAIEVEYNNINDFQGKDYEKVIYLLVNNGDYITNGELYLATSLNGSSSVDDSVRKITSELIRVGDYENPSRQYNNQVNYKQYNG